MVDAGYESYDNYSYCKENNIELYMKYSGYFKKRKKTEKNKFQKNQLEGTKEEKLGCPIWCIKNSSR